MDFRWTSTGVDVRANKLDPSLQFSLGETFSQQHDRSSQDNERKFQVILKQIEWQIYLSDIFNPASEKK